MFKRSYISRLLFFSIALFYLPAFKAQVCNAAGNVVIFSNYDGSRETNAGRLNIVADANIANLKIGICSYERVTVNITGPFVGNITAVRYAGFNAIGNCNCYWPSTPPGCAVTTTITGVPVGLITYCVYPAAPYNDPNGWPNILCAYQCAGGNQGGCNTPAQVVSYFMGVFGGTFRSHTTQYNCWAGATHSISTAGNCCLTVLPVELSSFEATQKNNEVSLNWTTLSEKNNKSFEIERSSSGENYVTIAEVKGSGTTHQKMNYNTVDPMPLNGTNYYRLKQIDTDGSFKYSAISSVYFEKDMPLFYPNPANDILYLKTGEEGAAVLIKNVIGQEVLKTKIASDKQLKISELPAGTYFVYLDDKVQKLVVSK